MQLRLFENVVIRRVLDKLIRVGLRYNEELPSAIFYTLDCQYSFYDMRLGCRTYVIMTCIGIFFVWNYRGIKVGVKQHLL